MIGEHIKIGEVVTVNALSFSNQLGGTECLKLKARVRITKGWEDYECGWRFHAMLLDEKDIERVRKASKIERAVIQLAQRHGYWKPKRFTKKVYVSEFEIVDPVLRKVRLHT